MNDFVIIADSTCDLSSELREKYDIDYFRMSVIVDNVPLIASLDYDEFSVKDLYDWMRSGKSVTTAQITNEEFLSRFIKYLDEGKDVLYIACSSGLSGSYSASLIIRDELLKKYPSRKIVCIDSLNSCMGQGIIAIKAAELRSNGATIEEVRDIIETTKLCSNQFCATETLTYLHRAGRVKGSKAFFGNLFGIKPIIISDAKGINFALPQKVKGRKKSLLEIIRLTKENGVDLENQILYVVHADAKEDAEFVKDELIKEVHPKEVYIGVIGPIIGASVGPGTVAIYSWGNKVTTNEE